MLISVDMLQRLQTAFMWGIISCVISFAWAPLLIKFLYKYKIVRNNQYDSTLSLLNRRSKTGTPIMGGLLIIITVGLLTILFNWERSYTWVPIGVMTLSALLGGIDDLLNIWGKERHSRSLAHTWRLIKVHKSFALRLWYLITLPWTIFKRMSLWFGSHPGKGIHAHEKLLLQFTAGALTAWWVYYKLGETWLTVHLPFDGLINLGWTIIPLIIFFVMFTANAVNVADGMDGLAGGSLIITFTALALLSWLNGYTTITILNTMVVGSLLAYTYFNVKPARFQMGDVGSLGLGSLMAINAIVINKMLFLPFLAFIFYIEVMSVIVQVCGRYLLGRRIFKMAPLHHHFELKGWSEEKTVMRFWIVHGIVVLIGIWIALY
jgi:phospho-N-acetylmuramoyl-pentapeptide-transferase